MATSGSDPLFAFRYPIGRFDVSVVAVLDRKAAIAILAALPENLRSAVSGNTNQEKDNPRILYWVAPMDPGYRRDGPGKSPMGMNLVPVYADGKAPQQHADMHIAPGMVSNLGVRTTEVKRGTLVHTLGAVGDVG